MVLRELTVTPTKRSFLPSLPGSRLHCSVEAQSDACLLGLEAWVKDQLIFSKQSCSSSEATEAMATPQGAEPSRTGLTSKEHQGNLFLCCAQAGQPELTPHAISGGALCVTLQPLSPGPGPSQDHLLTHLQTSATVP